MLTIERDGNGYRIKTKPMTCQGGVFAKTVNECRVAVTHYYEGGGHGAHPQPTFCPFCRIMKGGA